MTLAFVWQGISQAVNVPVNWPNTNWSMNVITHTGSNPQDMEADPTTDTNFAYDDDDTGSGSHDVIAAESPVIDLTPASSAGENFIKISGEYVYNNVDNDEYLAIEYWDADASNWVLLYQFPNQDTQGAPSNNYCSGTPQSYEASLDISGFSSTQLSGFKYRFIYNDDTTGGNGWNYGFCFSSPTLTSAGLSNPAFTLTVNPDCGNNQFSVDVNVTDLGGSSSVTISDDQGSSTQQLSSPGTVTFGPYSSGTTVTITVTSDDDNTVSSSDTATYTCPPTNDDCANALSLTVYPQGGGVGNETSASTTQANDSGTHPTCDNAGTNLDLWYSFTAPSSGKVKLIRGGTKGNKIESALYDSCGGTELFCFGYNDDQTFTGLTPGNTYILQVWHDSFNAGDFTIVLEEVSYTNPTFTLTAVPDCNNGQFSVDVEVTDLGGASSVTVSDDQGSSTQQLTAPGTVTFGPYPDGTDVTFTVTNDNDNTYTSSNNIQYFCPPANDDCANATSLTVYPQGGGVGNETSASTTQANDSGTHPTCDNAGTNLDLWYSFTAPSSGKVKLIRGGTKGNKIESALYDSCGGTELFCFGYNDDQTFTGLTPGNTYILQVWHDSFNAGDFTIVLEEVSYTNPTFTLTAVPDCNNGQFSVDVEVTDLGGASSVTVSDDQGSSTQQLTAPGTVTFGPYASGTNVTFTVTNNDNNSFNSSDNIQYTCPPANDDCANAIEVPDPLPYSNTQDASGATNNAGFIDCNGNGMNDGVWYKFTTGTVSGDITIEVVPQGWDVEVAVYTGSCGSFNCEARADGYGSGSTETLTFTPTANTTYYVNVGYYSSISDGSEGPYTITISGNVTLHLDGLTNSDFSFYPNPSTDMISWNATGNVEKIQITNLTGQVVMEVENPINNSLNIAGLNQGVYLLHVFMDGKEGTYKLIKE